MKYEKKHLTTGELIRMHRKGQDMTQSELAQLTGKDLKEISLYESGKRKPNRRSLVGIAKALQVDPSELQDSRLIEQVKKRPKDAFPQDLRIAINGELQGLSVEVLSCIYRAILSIKENHVND